MTRRRIIFGQRSSPEDDNKHQEKKTRKRNIKQDRMVRALEAIRLLAFDTTEGSSKKSSPCTTPRTVTTFFDDATEESNDESRRLKQVNRTKLDALRPLPTIDRSSSGGTSSAVIQRSDSNVSYLSSDTSSEILGDFEIDYTKYISFSAHDDVSSGGSDDITASSGYDQPQPTQSNSRRLSATTLEEWNRRCDEEGGVFRRENYASDMLNLNFNLNQSMTLNQNHQHGQGKGIDKRHPCSLPPIETDSYGHGYASFLDTSDEDISLTYSHDE